MGHVGRVNLSLTHDAVFSKVVLFLMDCFYTSIIAKKLLIKVAHFSLHEGKKTEQNGFDILEAVVLSMPRYVVDFLLHTVMALAQTANNAPPGTCWSNTSRRFSKFC